MSLVGTLSKALGTGEHIVGQGVKDLITSVESFPAGVYTLGKTAVTNPGALPGLAENMAKAQWQDIQHPLRHPGFTALDLLGLEGAVGGTLGRIGELSNISSRAGALPEELMGGRQAALEAGKLRQYNRIIDPVTQEQVPVGKQLTTALLHGPAQEERLLYSSAKDEPIHGWMYSKDPLIKAAQKQVDKLYERFPNETPPPVWRVLPPFWRSQSGRIQSASRAEALLYRREPKAVSAAFLKEHGGDNHSPAEHLAVRMVAEGTTPQALMAMHQRWIDSKTLSPRLERETRNRMALIPEAEKFLNEKTIVDNAQHVDEHGNVTELGTGKARTVPVIKDEFPTLQKYVEDARKLSEDRTWGARVAGILPEESELNRLVGPYSFVHSDQVLENLTRLNRRLGQAMRPERFNAERVRVLQEGIQRLKDMAQLGAHDPLAHASFKDLAEIRRFTNEAGLFRIPYKIEQNKLGIDFGRQRAAAYLGKKPRVPGTFTHPFRGAILKGGGGDPDIARLLAESYTEAHRFLGLRSIRNRLLASAVKTPESIPEQYRQLIRTDEHLRPGENITYPQAERMATARPLDQLLEQDKIQPEEAIAGGRLYEGIRRHLFPMMEELPQELRRAFTGTTKRGMTKYNEVPGYAWIDKRMLGDLNKRNPLWGAFDNAATAKFLRKVDTVNSLIKNVMLYLRPAYAFPNMLGNIGLNLVQQGAFAPIHTFRNFMLYRGLPDADKAMIRARLGEGYGSLQFEKGNRVQAAGAAFGRGYGKFVDDPMRINAWAQEARAAGFDTPEKVHALLTDPKLAEEGRQIDNIANDEIINYERLGPGEEAVLRRLVLFYPFIKGASRYANLFYKNHPVAAGLSAPIGQEGRQQQEEQLGALPSYAESLIPYGGSSRFPLVGNPMAFSILGEPADLVKNALNLVERNPSTKMDFAGNLLPVESSLLTLLTSGAWAPVAGNPKAPVIQRAAQNLYEGLPITSLINRLRGQSAGGAPASASIYPPGDLLSTIGQFALGGAMQPHEINRALANYRAYTERHPRG